MLLCSGDDESHARCSAAASCPLDYLPPPVCGCLSSHWPLVCQLVVASPLLSHHCHRLSSQHATSTLQRAASASQRATASCLLAPLLSFASLLPAGVTSHLIMLPPQVSILDPYLHLHWLVVASHLIALFLPPILSSTPPPLNALATHLPFASYSPQLVACVFDLVCQISWFMAICQGYAPTYLYTTGRGGCISLWARTNAKILAFEAPKKT